MKLSISYGQQTPFIDDSSQYDGRVKRQPSIELMI